MKKITSAVLVALIVVSFVVPAFATEAKGTPTAEEHAEGDHGHEHGDDHGHSH